MSDPESTLSFNLVDWKVREQILAATRDQLESLLCALKLPPATDAHRHSVKRLDEGGVPEVVQPYFVRRGLLVDRRRFARRAVELYENDFMRRQLEELAFVGGSTRSVGDLWLIDSDVVLCCCDSDYARCRSSQALDQFITTDAPPFVEFAAAHVMTRAMGGLAPEMYPLDQAYDPTAAAELAAAWTSRSTPSSCPRGCDTWRKDERWGTFGNRCDNYVQLSRMRVSRSTTTGRPANAGTQSLSARSRSTCDGRPAKFARFMRRRAHAASVSTSTGTGAELFVLD